MSYSDYVTLDNIINKMDAAVRRTGDLDMLFNVELNTASILADAEKLTEIMYSPAFDDDVLIVDARELFSLNGVEFVDAIYRRLLLREPDDDGMRTTYTALEAGLVTKADCIKNMLESEEGRKHGIKLKNFAALVYADNKKLCQTEDAGKSSGVKHGKDLSGIRNYDDIVINSTLAKELIDSKVLNVLSVAVSQEDKGPLFLISAIRWYVCNFDDRIKLYIAGKFDDSGIYKERVREKADIYNLEDNIVFLDDLSVPDFATYYLSCDIFLSSTQCNGARGPIQDAQYFGLPVVALDTKDSMQVIGDAGLLIKKSPRLFAAALETLKGSRRYRDYLRNAGFVKCGICQDAGDL